MSKKRKNKNRNKSNAALALSISAINTSNKTNKTQTETKEKTESKTETNTAKTQQKTYAYTSYFNRKNYNEKGKKNETNFPEFVSYCKQTQSELKSNLIYALIADGYDVVHGDGYIYAKGDIPVLLTAHMDTVHKERVKDFYEYHDEEKDQHIISSPQGIGGDDRCGVYMIMEIIKTHRCHVLFCEDEEIGGVGSDKFCRTKSIVDLSKLKYLIELDRANGNDAVFYDCDNKDFTKFIEDNTGYKEARGSFSDISNLSPECLVASVNLSCGYYNAHTTSEYVIVEEMLNTIDAVKKLLDVECEQFEYIEKAYSYSRLSSFYNKGNNSKYGYDFYDDYDYGYGYGYGGYYGGYYGNNNYGGYGNNNYGGYGNNPKSSLPSSPSSSISNEDEEKSLFIYVYDIETESMLTYVSNGKSFYESIGKFLMRNSSYCFDDIYDYEEYDSKVYDDGWYENI